MKEIEKNRKAFLEMKDDYDYNNIYNLYGYKINNLDDILIFLKEKNEDYYNQILKTEQILSNQKKITFKKK